MLAVPSLERLSGGFRRILEVLERGRAAEPDGPVRPGRALVALAVQDEQFPEDGTADGAGVREPFGGGAEREAVGLRGPVVLGDDGAEPVDHRPLDMDGTRRGRVDDALER